MKFPKVLAVLIHHNPYGWSEEELAAVEAMARVSYIAGRHEEARDGHAGLPATLAYQSETLKLMPAWMRSSAGSS